ncbi:F-type H+-transporting ATPase subunit delta [Glaciecola punicea ACAM 611]|jgi:F-type H+-transporting ATPase subunit delta|uniref:ATP synthase subunit delta n=1 Tax=Glaciecola punicea ACAM 611 TaxID=1121923 RepID=H5TDY9_9ALTE|nr:F0F1 ATP synthase subunit delta [Glaciecola punicea]OFA31064.1 ATP synthase F1 subunit delta [Glaciecola punicea]GAB56516.1 F-type H+-transporting ATPase subunit delta [Glaciecola punicea ACAM 611]
MSQLTTAARPYALAAFDFAADSSSIEEWQSMLVFAAEVAKNESIQQLIVGADAASKVATMFISICGEQLNSKGQNFVKILAENDRLALLPEISAMFNELKTMREKQVNVDVTSAIALDDAQINSLSAALEKRFDRKVHLNCSVDPSIVAGLIVKAGDTVIDGSLNSQLNRLNDALQA